MRFAIPVFPGSNCDKDCLHVLGNVLKQDAFFVFHKERTLPATDVVVLPGGFSYGDYLRSGAIARFSPIMDDVIRFANAGGIVIGICNGFQIMLEAGLLPGGMRLNTCGHFVCKDVWLKVENGDTILTRKAGKGAILGMPIAHAEGNYYAPPELLKEIEDNGLVLFRYCDQDGNVTPEMNPNGAANNIAGIMNRNGNCFGMMPHPERASECILGGDQGRVLFESLIQAGGGSVCKCGCRG